MAMVSLPYTDAKQQRRRAKGLPKTRRGPGGPPNWRLALALGLNAIAWVALIKLVSYFL
jgi:hypothetical protein